MASCIAACPYDSRLFDATSLTQDACVAFVGSNEPTKYPGADIWVRLTTWKFPLLQLVAIFPRPPLSIVSEAFVLVHILGDPIGTIANLLLKVASCQRRARFWDERFAGDLHERSDEERTRTRYFRELLDEEPPGTRYRAQVRVWKQLANIVDSYDEWGQGTGDSAQETLWTALSSGDSHTLEQRRNFLSKCQLTAKTLAADRATKFLPIIVAQCFFIGTIGIAFGRTPTASSGPTPQTFISIEAHSIAFSALYFWILPAVFLGSVIGVSQTQNAIPRILERFQSDIDRDFSDWAIQLPPAAAAEVRRRKFSGGLYSWLPRHTRAAIIPLVSTSRRRRRAAAEARGALSSALHVHSSTRVGLAVMLLCTVTAILISYRVPPIGFGCRSVAELVLALVWLLSAACNLIRIPNEKWELLFVFFKDLAALILTMGGVVAVQFGVMNRCSCYTFFGTAGLALPETERVSSFLFRSVELEYPLEAFACIAIQLLVVPGVVAWRYRIAMRVFLQRDDDASNLHWWHSTLDFCGRRLRAMRRRLGAPSEPPGPANQSFGQAGRMGTWYRNDGPAEQGHEMGAMGHRQEDGRPSDDDALRQSSTSSADGLLAAQVGGSALDRARENAASGSSSAREPGEAPNMRVRSF